MECRIENKSELRLFVYFKDFDGETCKKGIPALWKAHRKQEIGKEVSCYFGVCADGNKEVFQYGIGLYAEDVNAVPEGFQELCLPEHTWVVFKFEASTPGEIQQAWNSWGCIDQEWFSNEGYEIAADYGIEYYPSENSCEIWIPVRKEG